MPGNSESTLKPLKITCSSTDCDGDMHYYGPSRRKNSPHLAGTCKDCGAELVDWARVHKCSHHDIEHTVEMLKTEYWRHSWWHKDLDPWAINYARRKGRPQLKQRAKEILTSKIGSPNPSFEGRQTGVKKNPVLYAQHATGTCCRKCLEYWHNIPKDQIITEPQLNYLVELVMHYINTKIPDLSNFPEKVAPIRRSKQED